MPVSWISWTLSTLIIPQTIMTLIWFYKILCYKHIRKITSRRDIEMMSKTISQTSDNINRSGNDNSNNNIKYTTSKQAKNNSIHLKVAPKPIKVRSASIESTTQDQNIDISSNQYSKSNDNHSNISKLSNQSNSNNNSNGGNGNSASLHLLPIESKLLISASLICQTVYSYFLTGYSLYNGLINKEPAQVYVL